MHLQWSISDKSKQHVLVLDEFLSAVDRSINELLIITEDMHDTVDHAQSVPSRRRDVTYKRIRANSRRIGRIIYSQAKWHILQLMSLREMALILVGLVIHIISCFLWWICTGATEPWDSGVNWPSIFPVRGAQMACDPTFVEISH